MVNSIPDEFVLNSSVYRDVKKDHKIQEDSSYLLYSHESIIHVTEKIDDIYCSLQSLSEDKSYYKFYESELDESPYLQELVLSIAELCSGPFAHDTFNQYLYDSGLEQCQLHIALEYPSFFNSVSDKGSMLATAANHLALMA